MSSVQTDVERPGGGPREPGASVPAVVVRNLSKTFPGVQALVDVNLEIPAGEVRGLVGENGSGKSTLIRILAGVFPPDPGGSVEIFGQPLPAGKPWLVRELGVSVIYQELTTVPKLSVLENVFLGDYRSRAGMMAKRKMSAEFSDLCGEIGVDIDPHALAGECSVAEQTVVEIMRAVRRKARLVLMDEPTATLGRVEREALYALIAKLRAGGMTIVYISHDLDEVMRVSDSITVFRDGRHVLSQPSAKWTKQALVNAMLGEAAGGKVTAALLEPEAPIHEVDRHRDGEKPRAAVGRSEVDDGLLMSVRRLRVPGILDDVSFDLRRGQILGVAGLVGSGRSSLVRALVGLHGDATGELRVDGHAVPWPKSVPSALKAGIALLPEDRKGQGLVLGLPVYDNVCITDFFKVARRGFLTRGGSVKRARELLEQVNFRGRIEAPVRTLSGGNQQKVLFAKWLHRQPKVFLIDEPTRGVDVGAKAEMLRMIRELAARGAGIVWISSELEEVIAVSDRVILLASGRLVGEAEGEGITLKGILEGLFAVEDRREGAQRESGEREELQEEGRA